MFVSRKHVLNSIVLEIQYVPYSWHITTTANLGPGVPKGLKSVLLELDLQKKFHL